MRQPTEAGIAHFGITEYFAVIIESMHESVGRVQSTYNSCSLLKKFLVELYEEKHWKCLSYHAHSQHF